MPLSQSVNEATTVLHGWFKNFPCRHLLYSETYEDVININVCSKCLKIARTLRITEHLCTW